MSVIANSELGTWSGSKTLNGSVASLLPVPNANLKSLVLRSPYGLYHSLATNLRSFEYPSLETLVLENIVFDNTPSADGIEEFIIRHKSTLRRLELRSCATCTLNPTTSIRRWSTIWERLNAELVALEEVVVDSTSQGYALLDPTRGYIPHPAHPMASAAEDHQQFQELHDRVNPRIALVS